VSARRKTGERAFGIGRADARKCAPHLLGGQWFRKHLEIIVIARATRRADPDGRMDCRRLPLLLCRYRRRLILFKRSHQGCGAGERSRWNGVQPIWRAAWGGEFWTNGYFARTTGKHGSEETIGRYVENQGKGYNKLHSDYQIVQF
jgi:hypothetical protein